LLPVSLTLRLSPAGIDEVAAASPARVEDMDCDMDSSQLLGAWMMAV
jgi:hypothetical protein